ncbi:hypothetical protein A2U01_0078448, partial [Trifolium medium]|nr:hypothetical protein [Trifolium medium]
MMEAVPDDVVSVEARESGRREGGWSAGVNDWRWDR